MVFRETQGSVKTVFSKESNAFYNKVLEMGCLIGTQTHRNATELIATGIPAENVVVLPFIMTEPGLLKPNFDERKGVLFIGRWEPNKNPEEFVRLIRETGLPAKILTNQNGADKFKSAFDKLGITDVEYGIELVDFEKVNFILTSRVFYSPSLLENFSLATMECLPNMPCFVLSSTEWGNNFEGLHKVAKADMVRSILKAYENFTGEDIDDYYYDPFHKTDTRFTRANANERDARFTWSMFLEDFTGKQSSSSQGKINKVLEEHGTITIASFILNHIARSPSVEDIQTLYGSRHKYLNIITDDDTFLTTDDVFVPQKESDTLKELFA
jgi:hypothetical protein